MPDHRPPVEVMETPRASPLRVFKTVFWSFFGVRRQAENQADLAGVTPLQILAAGIVGAAMFVTTLVLLVRFIAG